MQQYLQPNKILDVYNNVNKINKEKDENNYKNDKFENQMRKKSMMKNIQVTM